MHGSSTYTELVKPFKQLKMKNKMIGVVHNFADRDKYRGIHIWLVNPNKINLYSTEDINPGDKIQNGSQTLTVIKSSASKPNADYGARKEMFYELETEK